MATNKPDPQEEPMAEWERELLDDWDRDNTPKPAQVDEHSPLVLGIVGLILVLGGLLVVTIVAGIVIAIWRAVL